MIFVAGSQRNDSIQRLSELLGSIPPPMFHAYGAYEIPFRTMTTTESAEGGEK